MGIANSVLQNITISPSHALFVFVLSIATGLYSILIAIKLCYFIYSIFSVRSKVHTGFGVGATKARRCFCTLQSFGTFSSMLPATCLVLVEFRQLRLNHQVIRVLSAIAGHESLQDSKKK